MILEKKPFENIVKKGENGGNQHFFSFSHNVFYHFHNNFQFLAYIYFVVCICFEFGPVQNFAVWERVKSIEFSMELSGYHSVFVAFVKDNATMSSVQYFRKKLYIVVCAKAKEVNCINPFPRNDTF